MSRDRDREVIIRTDDNTITIDTANPDLMRIKIADLAGVIAAGIEASGVSFRDNDWNEDDTVKRALRIATSIILAVRP